ncbi:hypothetical protein TrLO_g10098 [Triparma laevis f. longispina]|uniref:Uncharacterized protein n=1 Tax=Triparma laevis f. longispina TaxID=1714387 RepID=A0A9W7FFG4_9STRA|nr:hypothetical protein TrLO_g10098 [Triparma laevis f. longispina]
MSSKTFTCLKTLTRLTPTRPNTWTLSLIPPTLLHDVETFTPSLPSSSYILGGSPLGTFSHSGFLITEADEMYHTQWENFEGVHEVRLSPKFKRAKVVEVLVHDWDTFEVGDDLFIVEGEIDSNID